MNNEAYTIKLLKIYWKSTLQITFRFLKHCYHKNTHTHTHKMFTYSSDFFTIFFGPTVYWGIKSLAGRTVIHNVCVARTFDISLVPNFVSLILIGPSDYLWEPIRSGYIRIRSRFDPDFLFSFFLVTVSKWNDTKTVQYYNLSWWTI